MKLNLLLSILIVVPSIIYGQDEILNAKESEPENFGWMQGFPPPADRRLYAHDGSFFKFPALRYSVVHMREFMPTVNVPKGDKPSFKFNYLLDSAIDDIEFVPTGGKKKMTWDKSLQKSYADGIIILHKGNVVYEKYFGELDDNRVHAVMSVTKTFTGTLAAILVAEGILEDARLVESYIPELQGSAFGTATVRQLMDMTTGIKFSEKYADPKAEVWAFTAAGNPLPKPKGYDGPIGFYEYIKTVTKEGEHGVAFGYKTVNTDALGWVISRATNKSIDELLSERIWSKMGMELDSYYQIDALGTPFAGGGFNAGLRDLAKFGEMIRNFGIWRNEQLIPREAVEDIIKGGDKEAFAKSVYSKLSGWSYRNMWWMTHNEHNAYAARGVHGQTIYIDPEAEMVLVRLASHPVAANSVIDPFSLPAYHAIAKYLKSKK